MCDYAYSIYKITHVNREHNLSFWWSGIFTQQVEIIASGNLSGGECITEIEVDAQN